MRQLLKNFFWNTWDNLSRVFGYSAFGSIFNFSLIFMVLILWNVAKQPPHEINPPRRIPEKSVLFSTGYPRLEIKGRDVRLFLAAPKRLKVRYAVVTNRTVRTPLQLFSDTIEGKLTGGLVTVASNDVSILPLFSGSYRADVFYNVLISTEIAEGRYSPIERIEIPAFTSRDAYDFFSDIIYFLLLSLSFPVMAVIAHNARRRIEGNSEGFFRELALGTKTMFFPGLRIFLFNALIYFLFKVAFGFYLFNLAAVVGQDIPPLRWAAIGMTGWFFVFFTMMQVYLIPLLVYKPREKFIITLKRASLLVMDNVVVTFSVLLFTMVLFALSFFSLALITFLLPGIIVMLHITNFSILLNRYEPPEDTTAAPGRDDSAERETRSWRTIFRPWE